MYAVAANFTEHTLVFTRLLEQPRIRTKSELAVRVLEVGLCGTDHEIAEFANGEPPPGSDELVIGHEALATVVEVGDDVQDFRPGDLVVPMVRRPCPNNECAPCRLARPDFCTTGLFKERGIRAAHGFLTELVVDDQAYFVRVPHELREVAVLTEPLSIAEKMLEQVAAVQQRVPGREAPGSRSERALVLGAGSVGLLGALLLRLSGYEVYVLSRETTDSSEARIVRAIGATYISSREQGLRSVCRSSGPIALAYEATGVPELAFEVLPELGANSVAVLTGIPARDGLVELHAAKIMKHMVLKNQVVLGTVNAGRQAYEKAVADLSKMLERWPDVLTTLISGRHPLSRAPELIGSELEGIKHVVEVVT